MKYKIGLNVKNAKYGERQKNLWRKLNDSTARVLIDIAMRKKNKKIEKTT